MLGRKADVSAVTEKHRPGHGLAKNRAKRAVAGWDLVFGQEVNGVSWHARLPINTARQRDAFVGVDVSFGAGQLASIHRKFLSHEPGRAMNEGVEVAIPGAYIKVS